MLIAVIQLKLHMCPGDGAYSETLRLDDPLFWLDSTIKNTTKSTAGVRTTLSNC